MDTKIPIEAGLDAVKTGDNQVRIDVVLKNVPADLFGAAFHLEAGGTKWVLQRYEAGDVLLAGGVEPIILAEEKTGGDGLKEIVFGISLRRTDAVAAHDGVLARFYLWMEGEGGLEMKFTDTRLSVLDSAGRDVKNALWEPKSFNLSELETQKTKIRGLPEDLQASMVRPPADESFLKNAAGFYELLFACLLAMLTISAAYFLWKNRRDARRRGN